MAGLDARLPVAWLLDARFHSLGSVPWYVFTRSLMWSVGQQTDGFVPEAAVTMLFPPGKADLQVMAQLVTVGALEAVPGGWLIVDYGESQTLKAELDRRRKRNAEDQANWRDRQREIREGSTEHQQSQSDRKNLRKNLLQDKEATGGGEAKDKAARQDRPAKCRSCGHLELLGPDGVCAGGCSDGPTLVAVGP